MDKRGGVGIVVLVIVVIVGLGVGAYFMFFGSKDVYYYSDKAMQENNMSICLDYEDLEKPRYAMDCFRSVAYEVSDITLCQSAGMEIEVYNCYTAFIHTRWNFNQEVLCDKLSDPSDKNYCYMVTAIAKNDQSYCENIDIFEFETAIDDCKGNVISQNA